MPRYVIQLAYDGTRYFGWQKQPEAITVQGELEQAIRSVTQEDIHLYGSGRTDTGVHAEEQFAHFETHIPVEETWLTGRLQRMLPDDIHPIRIQEVPEHFHARFDAQWRRYRYQLILWPDPFNRLYGWYPGKGLDWGIMRECLKEIEGEHDFSGFSRKSGDLPHYRCTITFADLEMTQDKMVSIRIQSNRFLRSMMRSIVGALVQVGHGKKNKDWFKKHLHENREIDNIALAPAKGLFLEQVFYPESVLNLT